MNAAKHAQKLKHIRKVKAALRFREETQKRLAPIKKENKETKEYIVQRLRFINDSKKGDIKAARKAAREDWNLGPLRPNRAVGEDAERYGTYERSQMREPDIPKHWFDAKESVQKRMTFQIPEHVLLDHWPIVKDDRVVIIRGREANKIGIVKEIHKESNQITIKDLNKIWVDGRIFNRTPGEDVQHKREWEHSIPYDDVRLVIPWDVEEVDHHGNVRMSREDVIVDAVDMERHTSGTNPFTAQEDDPQIAEEEQVDPATGDVIWHRYIAGTRSPILWPWENSKQKEMDDSQRKSIKDTDGAENKDVGKSNDQQDEGSQSIVRKGWGKVQKLLRNRGKKPEDAVRPNQAGDEEIVDDYNPKNVTHARPRERDPPDYPDDTKRNMVEIDENNPAHFVPTLVFRPIPETVVDELRDLKSVEKDGKYYEEQARQHAAERKEMREAKEQERQARINSMKTPMQIRWELEQAKKSKYDPKTLPEPNSELLKRIGKAMENNGRSLDDRLAREGLKSSKRMANKNVEKLLVEE